MSHYDVLGVAPAVDDAALRRAYVALARRHHPDLAGGDPARMRALNEAWATLGDPVRRARYDLALASATVSSAPTASEPMDVDDFAGIDDFADLDDRAVRVTVRLPRWLGLLPVALFAAGVATFFLGLVFASGPMLGLALMALALSFLFFLAAPFIALFAARSGGSGRPSQQ